MKLFDTHTHYDDAKFDALSRRTLLTELFETEVDYILGAAVNTTTSRFTVETAKAFAGYYAAVGIHPQNVLEYGESEEALNAAIFEIEALLQEEKVVAIGEIGYDFYWEDNALPEWQKAYFERQMALAEKYHLPVIIHDREAHGATMDMILSFPRVIGVLHSFSGSIEMARELVKRGWYISFSGVITYKNATRISEVVPTIPKDRILVETDCPYLSPVPMRGKMNHSGYVKYTAAKAAELRGEGYQAFIDQTTENAKRLFGIK